MVFCRAPVAQSVATRAVNPGDVSSNPGSANFLSDDSFDKSQCDMRHSSSINGLKSMWKSSQLFGKIVVWSTGVRKPGKCMSR